MYFFLFDSAFSRDSCFWEGRGEKPFQFPNRFGNKVLSQCNIATHALRFVKSEWEVLSGKQKRRCGVTTSFIAWSDADAGLLNVMDKQSIKEILATCFAQVKEICGETFKSSISAIKEKLDSTPWREKFTLAVSEIDKELEKIDLDIQECSEQLELIGGSRISPATAPLELSIHYDQCLLQQLVSVFLPDGQYSNVYACFNRLKRLQLDVEEFSKVMNLFEEHREEINLNVYFRTLRKLEHLSESLQADLDTEAMEVDEKRRLLFSFENARSYFNHAKRVLFNENEYNTFSNLVVFLSFFSFSILFPHSEVSLPTTAARTDLTDDGLTELMKWQCESLTEEVGGRFPYWVKKTPDEFTLLRYQSAVKCFHAQPRAPDPRWAVVPVDGEPFVPWTDDQAPTHGWDGEPIQAAEVFAQPVAPSQEPGEPKEEVPVVVEEPVKETENPLSQLMSTFGWKYAFSYLSCISEFHYYPQIVEVHLHESRPVIAEHNMVDFDPTVKSVCPVNRME